MENTDVKIGFFFSGGGAKGSYQIGVWKALEEYNLAGLVKSVSGSSVGALNALMFAFSDCKHAEDIWLNHVSKDTIFKPNIKNIVPYSPTLLVPLWFSLAPFLISKIFQCGFFSQDGLETLINLAFEKIKHNKKVSAHASVYDFMGDKAEYFLLKPLTSGRDNCRRILKASSAIPLIYSPVKVKGLHYYDGGCIDNIPLNPVYKERPDIIIIVNIEGVKTTIDYKNQYPEVPIIEIKPSEYIGGMFEGALNFNKQKINDCFELGYLDGCRAFKSLAAGIKRKSSIPKLVSKISTDLQKNLCIYPDDNIAFNVAIKLIRNEFLNTGDIPNVKMKTNGGLGYFDELLDIWDFVDSHNGWSLQRNKKTNHYRILDPEDKRVSWGTEVAQTYKFYLLSNKKKFKPITPPFIL